MSHDFRLEDHPIVLMRPGVVPPFGWVGHIPFAYLAVDLLRPRCIVELGTHSGNSYLAMCQAVHSLNLSTECFAIDTWQGDSHASHYSEHIYQSLRARHDPRYGEFSQLLRSSFDDALKQFGDHSIDLLHIDGLHTYEAVKSDFETWLPKLSDKAVVLLHDTATENKGFGVHKFFKELSENYPCFDFHHSHGLGVLSIGAKVPESFTAFMRHAQTNPAAIRAFFEALAKNLVDAKGHAQRSIHEPQPLISHLYYRGSGEPFDDARKLSMKVDVEEGVLDLHFQLPLGVFPAYLRIDPADFPGVYCLQEIWLRIAGAGPQRPLERFCDRLGHIQGELLPSLDPRRIRFTSFDDDPNVEFEVGSALNGIPSDVALEVIIRIDYEIVVTDPSMRRLMERQALTDMREHSRIRIDVQSLTHDMSLRLANMEQTIERLANRNMWSWAKRGRGR